MSTLKITQVRSPNGSSKKQRDTLRTLGLGRIGKETERPDDPGLVRGLVRAVAHLVEVEVDGEERKIGLHNLKPAKGSTHRRKRVGRGEGSGTGKTSGRGHKGAGSRSGAKNARTSRAGRSRSTCGCASCAART